MLLLKYAFCLVSFKTYFIIHFVGVREMSVVKILYRDMHKLIKPGFHMIVRIVRITPVISKYFKTIRTTGAIGSFHVIVSIASKARDVGSSVMSLGQTIEFLSVFCKQATQMDDSYL